MFSVFYLLALAPPSNPWIPFQHGHCIGKASEGGWSRFMLRICVGRHLVLLITQGFMLQLHSTLNTCLSLLRALPRSWKDVLSKRTLLYLISGPIFHICLFDLQPSRAHRSFRDAGEWTSFEWMDRDSLFFHSEPLWLPVLRERQLAKIKDARWTLLQSVLWVLCKHSSYTLATLPNNHVTRIYTLLISNNLHFNSQRNENCFLGVHAKMLTDSN